MKKFFTNERIIIAVLAILLGITLTYFFKYKSNSKSNIENQMKLTEALTDDIRTYVLDKKTLIEEKKTIQGDYNELLENEKILNKSQKTLLDKVNSLNKKRKRDKEIFAAAQIKYEKLIDSLNSVIGVASSIDTINNSISFLEDDTTKNFLYNIDIKGVRPYPIDKNPTISFNQIDFPNIQTVTFNFDNTKRKDYPISFSVINTNPYFKSQNIESYTIQGLQKQNVDPSGWNKAWSWIKLNGKYLLVGATGYVLGSAINGN